jgi:hypothetical protein
MINPYDVAARPWYYLALLADFLLGLLCGVHFMGN